MEPANLIGKTLAGCRLVAFVGGGSTGEVFKGIHEALQRPVAVKVVRVQAQAQGSIDSLMKEARSLAKLAHPNIVQVYDVGLQGAFFYIVMQFLEGITLKARFDESGALPVEDVYSVVGDVARGLGAMHHAGLIHRDLKLENVLVAADGGAKIMDFGVVRDTGAQDDYQGHIVGTPPYLPPEVWLGRTADARSDLYSLGVMLYALLCGEYPFRARTTQEYRELHLNASPQDPASVKPDIGDALSAITLKLLARERARRYGSVEEFLKDFDRCRRGTAPEALGATGRKVKCGFCESMMPAQATKCTVCGEGLHVPKQLELKTRVNEVACPACGSMRERRARACPNCGKGICGNCLRGIAIRENLCAECLAID